MLNKNGLPQRPENDMIAQHQQNIWVLWQALGGMSLTQWIMGGGCGLSPDVLAYLDVFNESYIGG